MNWFFNVSKDGGFKISLETCFIVKGLVTPKKKRLENSLQVKKKPTKTNQTLSNIFFPWFFFSGFVLIPMVLNYSPVLSLKLKWNSFSHVTGLGLSESSSVLGRNSLGKKTHKYKCALDFFFSSVLLKDRRHSWYRCSKFLISSHGPSLKRTMLCLNLGRI